MKLRFAGCEIDLAAHAFTAGGDVLRLEPQVFDLLALLADRPGALISRDEIVEAVWRGRIVSDSAIDARVAAARRAVGDDGRRQAVIQTVPRRGLRLVAEVERIESTAAAALTPAAADIPPQRVRFTRSADGAHIAWAQTGDGPPLIRAGIFLSHLERDWRCLAFAECYRAVAAATTLVRYDQRGAGLSESAPAEMTLERYVEDLDAVADAAGLERFALWGGSQGSAIAIAFAALRPERVSRLFIYGGFMRGRIVRGDAAERARAETALGMIREGWGAPDGPFLQAFASLYMPDATPEELSSLVALQRASATPEQAVRIRRAVDRFDVSDLIGKVRAPTLVAHCTHDGVQPFEEGRRIAEAIPGAEFLPIDSRNHAPLGHDANWASVEALIDFVTRAD